MQRRNGVKCSMKNKYLFVLLMLVCIAAAGLGLTTVYVNRQQPDQDDKMTVVTSFYPMYIAAMNVIGDCEDIELENLSEPQTGCLHDYQLTPEDMKLLSTADVFVVNGGGIESFLQDVAAEYPDLTIIDSTEGMELLEDNPHAWMSLALYEQQVENIADGLTAYVETINGMESVDEDMETEKEESGFINLESASLGQTFEENARTYIQKIRQLEAEAIDVKDMTEGAGILSFHEAYAYVAEDFGMDIVGEMDLDEERQISAGEVAAMVDLVREKDVKVILAEELYGKSMGDAIQAEVDVNVVYLDPLTRGDYEADGYLDAMEHNIQLLREVFLEP